MYTLKVFDELEKNYRDEKNSHAYIFYTNNFDKCKNDVNTLIKKIYNIDNINLISSDLFVIPMSDKRNILKEDVSYLKDFFQHTSYLNDKRFYLIEELHKLNSFSANMILKFLEEPLKNVNALFITTNLDSVLLTIKSRCQIINCFYDSTDECDINNYNLVKDLLEKKDYVSLITMRKKYEKVERNELIKIFNDYLVYSYNNFDITLRNNIFVVNKVITMLNNNVSIDYIFDYIFFEGGGA